MHHDKYAHSGSLCLCADAAGELTGFAGLDWRGNDRGDSGGEESSDSDSDHGGLSGWIEIYV